MTKKLKLVLTLFSTTILHYLVCYILKDDKLQDICIQCVTPRYLENIELTAYLCKFFLFHR